MYLCYLDESGTPDIPGNTSHYVLSGLAIPIDKWKSCDSAIEAIKKNYQLEGKEIHTGWILRSYREQSQIPDFDKLCYLERRSKVAELRKKYLLDLQKSNKSSAYKQAKKNYRKSDDYIHLTLSQRRMLIKDIAEEIANWNDARIFAECIDKVHFNPLIAHRSIDEQALEQIITRFQLFLKNTSFIQNCSKFGLLIHDNNETVARKHTELMKKFHSSGTFWSSIDNIIETPLFVNSELTGMIQLSDVCSYAIRRYLENQESDLFNIIFKRGDRKNGKCVGIRHFTNEHCTCLICKSH